MECKENDYCPNKFNYFSIFLRIVQLILVLDFLHNF